MLNFASMLLFSADPANLVSFYTKVFQKSPDWSGGDFKGWKLGEGKLAIGPHDKVTGKNPNPERVFFNFESDSFEADFERIKDIGAEIIQEPYHPEEQQDMQIATFADPDGNYFQLTTPFEIK